MPRPVRMLAVGIAVAAAGCGSPAPRSPASSTVTGTVLDGGGNPRSGLTVAAGGLVAASDVAGRFTLAGVKPPYDLSVVSPADQAAVVIRGVRRLDPVVFFGLPAPPRSAIVSGSVTGGIFPQPADRTTQVAFTSPAAGASAPADPAGAFTAPVDWGGPGTVLAGTLHAIQIRLAGGVPVGFEGYGARAGVTLRDGVPLPGQDVALSPVAAAGTLSGSVTAPAGYDAAQGRGAAVEFAGQRGLLVVVPTEAVAAGPFSYLVPDLGAGASLVLYAEALSPVGEVVDGIRRGLPAGAAPVTLDLPAAPSLLGPADGASASYGSVFSWSAYPGGVHTACLGAGTPAGPPSACVVTGEASAPLPDLTSLGLSLPAGQVHAWMVFGEGPFAGVDDYLSGDRLARLVASFGQSAERTFRLQ